MAGVIASLPKFQFSANGVPMVGGTLEVYVAGTTTPTNTWQDSALSIANTNPITLDARGECVLWLDPAVVYKFVLKNAPTSGGVVQWTQDNISSAAALANTLRTDLAASSGASLVGRGTGTVATALTAVEDRATTLEASATRLTATTPKHRPSRPAFIEQHLSSFFGRGMLTDEAINVATEQALTASAAAGVDVLALTSVANLVIGGCVTVKHDNGLYGTYFVDSISTLNIGIRPSLRYACTVAGAKIERTWFNRAHPGKFYMRELAQRIALSTELDAAMPNGNRALYTNVSSNPNTLEDTLVATGAAAINYFAASNLGISGTVTTPVRFALGRSAYVDNILAVGDGAETQLFDVRDVANAVVKVALLSASVSTQYSIQVFDELGVVRGKQIITAGAGHGVTRIYSLVADLRGAKRIKVRVACEVYSTAGSYFSLHQIDVFEAPQAAGKIVANPGAKIVVLGDSWVAGDLASTAEREPITTRLALELPYATVVNAGVGGNTIVNMLARFDTDVTPHTPDYVVVVTGTNESYNPLSATFDPNAIDNFINYYRDVLNKIAAIGARPIIIGVPALAQSDADVSTFPEWQLNDRARLYARYVFERQGRKPVVATGSNANGSWTKFDDGTLICRHTVSVATTAINTIGSTTWTYPMPFLAGTVPKITVSVSGYGTEQTVGTGTNAASATTASVVLVTAIGATTLPIDCVAVGRWYA